MKSEKLRERVIFEKRMTLADPGDGAGTYRADWVEQFERWASVTNLIGGETVIAARLSGIQPCVITVRMDSETKLIKADWRARHKVSGDIYNLRAPNPAPDRSQISFMAETGEASG